MLSCHVEDYHYGNTKDNISSVLEVFLRNDVSNLTLDGAYNKQQLPTTTNQYYNEDGFDCVIKFKLVHDTTNHTYKWFREWNSGFLEHGGIVVVSGASTTVPLNWTYTVGASAKTASTYANGSSYSVSLSPFVTTDPATYTGTVP